MPSKDSLHAQLEETRARTWLLADGLTDDQLGQAVRDFLSPPSWDLGHIANFEELWLVQKLLDCPELHDGFNDTYDAFRHPRQERPQLALLDRDGVKTYMEEVRARTRKVLDGLRMDADCGRLVKDGFVYEMIALHEQQHQETLLQTINLHAQAHQYQTPKVRQLPAPRERGSPWVDVPAGPFPMGTTPGPGVYDNESPRHEGHTEAYQLGRYPVTTGEYLAFMEAGGYEQADHWSERGWTWAQDHDAPMGWKHLDGAWHRVGHGCEIPIAEYPNEILCHVSHFEAEAYASWAGARLPTEAEWEKAARGPAGTRNPWGDEPATVARANIDQLAFTTSRIGAFPGGASGYGCEHMIGDVWEWTSSGFEPYPGFEAYPYDEYSKVFFGGDYKVLRGGAWATRAGCANGTFRNWDHPYRRQIFCGFRLAR